MKLTQVTARFNKVKTKDANDVETIQQRPSFKWDYPAIEGGEDISSYPTQIVCAALNSVLESFGATQIRENAKNWEFKPEAEKINLHNWHIWYSAEITRTRAVTAVTLDNFAKVYVTLSQSLLNKPAAVAGAGGDLIRKKFSSVMGKGDILTKMGANIVQLMEAVESSATPDALEDHAEVISALLTIVADSTKETVTVDSL